jgi:GNAT superfamily N-acetyltransferase
MIAVPVSVIGQQASGPRPIDLNKDSRQILNLLDMAFGPIPRGRGQRMLITPSAMNTGSLFGSRIGSYFGNVAPGFVWEEGGRIVGTLSLLEARKPGRYLVANVAVNPQYKRRGIATGLMISTMDYIRSLGGHEVLLQVERDNDAANSLYSALNYRSLGEVNRWEATSIRLRLVASPANLDIHIRPASHRDAEAAFLLDRRCMPFDLRWPNPPEPKMYEKSLWRRFSDLLNGRKMDIWVADAPLDRSRKRRMVGLAYIESEWSRPHEIAIRVPFEQKSRIERALLSTVVGKIKQNRSGRLRMSHPAQDDSMTDLLKEANFTVKRSLRVMHIDLDRNG